MLQTCACADILKQSSPSRIVNVSSIAYKMSSLELDNLNFERHEPYGGGVYGASKLANILFTRELSKRMEGTGIIVNINHHVYYVC